MLESIEKAGVLMDNIAMVALTDFDWYSCLLHNPTVDVINFWTPTPWNIKKLKKGNKVYFLLKEKYGRKICGYGDFEKYENLNIETAWNSYGICNGVDSLAEFKKRVSAYTEKNSKKGFNDSSHIIGCIIINNAVLFNESEQTLLSLYGWDIPKQVVKYKYVELVTQADIEDEQNTPFQLVADEKRYKHTKSQDRKGQHKFRKLIMRAYNKKCCITGETEPSLLQAAHIHSYISDASNHVQNGLLFRIDLHNLFDEGLITIDENYKVRVSIHLASKYYRSFEASTIFLPELVNRPSIDALNWHYEFVFRK